MLKDFLSLVKDALIPRLCFSCQKKIETGYLCPLCFERIEFLRLDGYQKANPPFERIISAIAYKDPVIKMLHLYKYMQYAYLSDFFSSLMIRHLKQIRFSLKSYQIITCVPMHQQKQKNRDYNQAELLGQRLSSHFQIPYRNDIIFETRLKPSQTVLNKAARSKNTVSSFKIKNSIEGKKVIIVDDILTTGSTLKASALALSKAGAQSIIGLTLAKTLKK